MQNTIYVVMLMKFIGFVFSNDEGYSDGIATDDITFINKDLNDLVEGDIVQTLSSRNAIKQESMLWKNATLPIVYGKSLSLEAIGAVEEAKTEFALRTCIDIKHKGQEEDYVVIESLNGCWSWVGKRGENQTLSLGRGCHYKRTAVHEFLHALGFYHEQSRKDRNDYIRVGRENVIFGKLHNFGQMFSLDNLREEYDLDSLMHYTDTAFSRDGKSKTILTKDPHLQNRISISKDTFSNTDVRKVNKLYNCGDTLLYSYNCDFADRTMCGWVIHNHTWSWVDLTSLSFPSVDVEIPTVDATHDKHFRGGYVYTTSTKRTQLKSRVLRTMVSKQCLRFWYYLKTQPGSNVRVRIEPVEETAYYDNFNFTLDANTDTWTFFRKTVSVSNEYRIIFETELSEKSVIALDDINIVDRPCDTAYFSFPSFKSILANTTAGEYMYSNTAVTDDFYSFKLRIYLNGTNESNKGVVFIFFNIVPGINESGLQWPFQNRKIRFSLMDQQSNALEAQHLTRYLKDFHRKSSQLTTYSESSVIKTDHLLSMRKFVKHDTLIITVSIEDMTPFLTALTPPGPTVNDKTATSAVTSKPTTQFLDTTNVNTQPTSNFVNTHPTSVFVNTQPTPTFATAQSTLSVTCGKAIPTNDRKIMFILIGVICLLFLSMLSTCILLKVSHHQNERHKTKKAIQTGKSRVNTIQEERNPYETISVPI